jgi:2Fe-2S ferredoxin
MASITAIDRDGESYELDAKEGLPLMEALRDEGLVEAICGGMCSCATCHCYIDEGDYARLGPPEPEEDELLDSLEYRDATSRLTCQITVEADCEGLTLTVAPEE